MAALPLICFLGACIRILFYRLIGNKNISMSYLQGKEDEQQITSLIFGFGTLFLIVFVVFRLI